MMNSPFDQSDDMPVYVISVAAELSGMHPQTLREYEAAAPAAGGGTRCGTSWPCARSSGCLRRRA
jgi:MerR family transcriptional regulator/heat shock protein HspR